ncbi:MAG: hypothetical protein Q7R79_01505 [bacterium]|nr:hypothetical protein [bacterium]
MVHHGVRSLVSIFVAVVGMSIAGPLFAIEYLYCPSGTEVRFFCADGPNASGGKTTFYINLGGSQPSSCTASGSPEWSGNLLQKIKQTYPSINEKTLDTSNQYRTLSFTIPVSKKTLFTLDCKEKIGAFEVGTSTTGSSQQTQSIQEICNQKNIPDLQCTTNSNCTAPAYTGICGRQQKVTVEGHQTLVRYCQKQTLEKLCAQKGTIDTKSTGTDLIKVKVEERRVYTETVQKKSSEDSKKLSEKISAKMPAVARKIESEKYAGALKLISHGDPSGKHDHVFIGIPSDFKDEKELGEYVQKVFTRSFMAYSPMRENVTRMNIWVAVPPESPKKLLTEEKKDDQWAHMHDAWKFGGEMRKKYTFAEDITILSKEAFRAHALSGNSYVSISNESVPDVATVVLHEFAHAFGGVPDEYIVYDGTEKDNPPTCYEQPLNTWPQKDKPQTIIDHRSQDGIFPLIFARFEGCKVKNLWRPYDVSIMKAPWRIGGRYSSFGPIHSEQFNKRFNVFTKGTREGGTIVPKKSELILKIKSDENPSIFQGTRGDLLQFTLAAEHEPVDVESVVIKGDSGAQTLTSLLKMDGFSLRGRGEDIAIRGSTYDKMNDTITLTFLPLTIYPDEPLSLNVNVDAGENEDTTDKVHAFTLKVKGTERETATALASNSLSRTLKIHPSFSFFARTATGEPTQQISVIEGDPVQLEWDALVLKKLSGFNWCGRPSEPASEEWKWNDFITSQQPGDKIKGIRAVSPLVSTVFRLKCRILDKEIAKDVRVEVWSKPFIEYLKVTHKNTEVNGKDISDTNIASLNVPLNDKVSLSWGASKTQKCTLETSFFEKNKWVSSPIETLASTQGAVKGEKRDLKVSKNTQYVFRCILNTKKGEQVVSQQIRVNATNPRGRNQCPKGYIAIQPQKRGGKVTCYGL